MTRNLVPTYELVVSSASGTISFVVLNPESRTSGNIPCELFQVDAQQSRRRPGRFIFHCSRGMGSWKQSTGSLRSTHSICSPGLLRSAQVFIIG